MFIIEEIIGKLEKLPIETQKEFVVIHGLLEGAKEGHLVERNMALLEAHFKLTRMVQEGAIHANGFDHAFHLHLVQVKEEVTQDLGKTIQQLKKMEDLVNKANEAARPKSSIQPNEKRKTTSPKRRIHVDA